MTDDPAPTLAARLRAEADQHRAALPAEGVVVMDAAVVELRERGVGTDALAPGAPVPSVRLPGADGAEVDLADLLARGPVVLSFYRGAWCPYCNTELRALQQVLGDLEAAGASLVAVSPNRPDLAAASIDAHELEFPVLTDLGNEAAAAFGVAFEVPADLRALYEGWGMDLPDLNGEDSWTLPVPATFVLAPDGTVAWNHVEVDHTRRAEPADVLAAVRALTA